VANKRTGKKTNHIMVRLDNRQRARFDYLKKLRREVLHVEDSDGGLMGTNGMREAERQIVELEAQKAAAQQSSPLASVGA
jgi:hypothetical protein